jgi:hypothetical protein
MVQRNQSRLEVWAAQQLKSRNSQISIILDNLTHFRPKHEAKGPWSLNESSLKSEMLKTS